MPKILVTRTLGRNVVAGSIRFMPASTIARLSAEAGSEDWYVVATDAPRGQGQVLEQAGETLATAPGARARERRGTTLVGA